jgi:hypothetical protein
MKKYEVRVMLPALVLAAIVMLSFGIADALAQCGGNSGNMHSQHMGYSGQMALRLRSNRTPTPSTPATSPLSNLRSPGTWGRKTPAAAAR